MSQNNQRKEPVFGEPLTIVENEPSISLGEKNVEPKIDVKPYVSLRSTQSPGHTFTPIMRRTGEVANPSLEETVENTKVDAEASEPLSPTKAFSFTPIMETPAPETNAGTTTEPVVEAVEPLKISVEDTVSSAENEAFTTERIIPTAAAAATATAAKSTDAVKPKMSAKSRRLLLVALLALALLVLFFLLKPNTPATVEELQSQGSSLPIEFRPVDEAEAKRAEEQARAEQEAAKQPQQQETQTTEPAQTGQAVENTQNSATATQAQPNTETAVKSEAKVVEHKPVVSQTVSKPQTQGSVVYQPENAQPKATPKVERLTPQTTAKETTKVVVKPAAEKMVAPKAAAKAEPENTKPATASTSIKTMTVPKGVSLMQVFRDNNLNISDVNAMSKVNSIVSNLKVGERVTVRLDNNNRVVEMSLGSGGKFTRQANGSYTFK